MLTKKKRIGLLIIALWFCLFLSTYLNSAENSFSTNITYKLIEISKLTRYKEDRISFQQIQHPGSISYSEENAIANLLIIKNDQIYLFRDGFDDAKKIEYKGHIMEIRRDLPEDLWINKINSKPDYVQIADRRIDRLLNVSEEYAEKNFGDFYRNVRNAVINKHVQIFRSLMKDRIESGLSIVQKRIYPPAFREVKEDAKLSTAIKAKAIDGTIYYAEDMDGDDITETFFVNLDDGFDWGYKSGPNILFIYNNQEDNIKQLMGKLCYEAIFGTTDEENTILKTFPKDSEIIEAFKLEKVTLQATQSTEKQTPKK